MIKVIRSELYLITKLVPSEIEPTKKPRTLSNVERRKKDNWKGVFECSG
jgi:hypothetical protein